MKHATYIGKPCGKNVDPGVGAIIRESEKDGVILAQFDAYDIWRGGYELAIGWHEFPASDFQVDDMDVSHLSLETLSWEPKPRREIPTTYGDQYGTTRWSDTGEKVSHGDGKFR